MPLENPLATHEFDPDQFVFYDGLTEAQSVYVYWRQLGFTPTQAAKKAGYKQPKKSGVANERTPRIQQLIREAMEATRVRHNIDRDRVIEGLMDAMQIARVQSDPKTMVTAWTEIARITGVQAPEVKELRIEGKIEGSVTHKLGTATDQQLLELLGKDRELQLPGRVPDIEGEYEYVEMAEDGDSMESGVFDVPPG